MKISIRALEAIAELQACEALQRRVWNMPDNLDVVPLHLLLTAQKQGGVLLGAFDGDVLVGFVFGFPGLMPEGRPKHCSHMMGIAAEYQSHGIGYRLKLAQRDAILAQGIELATWTYDPLESRNAYLNMGKLGVICRSYTREMYGSMQDGLNVGLPSDRFEVEWWVASERVRRRVHGEQPVLDPQGAFPINATFRNVDGLLAPGAMLVDADADVLLVEIPADYQAIKHTDPGLALEWRLATRQIFETYFEAGYIAADSVSHRREAARRSFYVLRAGTLDSGDFLGDSLR